MKKLIFLGLTLISLVSCDLLEADNSYKMQYVVESYLVADQEFPPIVLTKTLPLDELYTLENAAVTSGNIRVYELNNSGNPIDSIIYFRNINSRAVYYPHGTKTVKPLTRYRLQIIVTDDNNHIISAETFVPGAFSAVQANADSVFYQSDDQFEVNYTPSFYPNRQSYYILNVVAQDTTGDLTPFYAAATADDNEPTRTELQRNSSGILNEANFDVNPDQTITIRLPWLAVAFYGDHIIEASTIDDNIYDFLRSEGAQFGGGTISPGEIYDIIDHIDGGTGVFGSYYRVQSPVYIKKNPLLSGFN
jgi:hypothetical protein